MGYDDRCFAADLVDLARQGALRIEERDGAYSLHREASHVSPWPPAQRALLQAAFAQGPTLDLKKSEHQRVSAARTAHREVLDKENAGRYFNVNAKYGVIGTLFALVSLGLGVWAMGPGDKRASGVF